MILMETRSDYLSALSIIGLIMKDYVFPEGRISKYGTPNESLRGSRIDWIMME